jgi:phosphoglycerate kinase
LENLRFWPEEEANDENFARKLAGLADVYVNEAFAASHRKHASIVGIPQYLPSAFGFHFLEEVEVLDKVRSNPARPATLILGGAKEDKLDRIKEFSAWADQVLIGGKLPKFIRSFGKVVVAQLTGNGKDISPESAEEFKKIISLSKTVVWAGPMGVYEEGENAHGTREVAQAVVDSGAYSVVGGGDTEAALSKLGFNGKMSYISTGGGAMLEFLANGILPGIEAIKKYE